MKVGAPERIWIEADDECPYFYEAHELHDVEQDVIEYVRADLYAALEAQLAETQEKLIEANDKLIRQNEALSPAPEAQQEPDARPAEQAVTEAMVERAFRDGVRYGTICEVTDIDEAWRTSAVRAALKEASNEQS